MKLNGDVVLVTGSTRGIGKAIALLLARHGARVVLNYKKSDEDCAEVERQIKSLGGLPPLVCRADVTNPDEFRAMIDRVVNEWGRLDALVNNADDDRFINEEPTAIDERDWHLIIQGALYSVYYGCKYAIRVMRRQGGGRIVNIGAAGDSDYTLASICLPYYLAKGGVRTLTKILAAGEAKNNILINCVSPGFIDNYEYDENLRLEVEKRIPCGRLGTPEEVAKVVLFLVGGDISYIQGENLNVAGGI